MFSVVQISGICSTRVYRKETIKYNCRNPPSFLVGVIMIFWCINHDFFPVKDSYFCVGYLKLSQNFGCYRVMFLWLVDVCFSYGSSFYSFYIVHLEHRIDHCTIATFEESLLFDIENGEIESQGSISTISCVNSVLLKENHDRGLKYSGITIFLQRRLVTNRNLNGFFVLMKKHSFLIANSLDQHAARILFFKVFSKYDPR